MRETLSFLGKPIVKQKQHNNAIIYRIISEDGVQIRLKIEVNTREHFSVFGIKESAVDLKSEWISGEAMVPTFELEELLSTKLRALYQRKKGRDLFDLWYALTNHKVDIEKLITAFHHYMEEEGNTITQKDYLENMEKKIEDPDFIGDMNGLLRTGIEYDIKKAYELVKTNLLEKI